MIVALMLLWHPKFKFAKFIVIKYLLTLFEQIFGGYEEIEHTNSLDSLCSSYVLKTKE